MNSRNSFCTIYFIRHGQSESNQADVLGQKDSKLTEKGREQAKKRALEFKNIKFNVIYSSNFVRANETAQIIVSEQAIKEVIIDEALHERSWGKLEGVTSEQGRKELKRLREDFERLGKEERYKVKMTEGMESDEEALQRLTSFIKKMAKKHAGETVLLAGYANILKILLVHSGFGTWQELPPGTVEHTGYVKLRTDGNIFLIDGTKGLNKRIN